MACYGKKGEAIEYKGKKDSQKDKLLNKYTKENNVQALSNKELHMLSSVMMANGKIFSVKGCKGLDKSKNKFVADSIRIVEKEGSGTYGIVLTNNEGVAKKLEVNAKELSTILDKYFGVKCSETRNNEECIDR